MSEFSIRGMARAGASGCGATRRKALIPTPATETTARTAAMPSICFVTIIYLPLCGGPRIPGPPGHASMLAFARVNADGGGLMGPRAVSFVIALLLTATACANGGTQTTSRRSTAPVVRAGERQNNKTITLRQRQRLQIILHSTYWQFQDSSGHAVLRRVGKPRVRPARGCVPGAGCGTVTALYLAAGPGIADVRATRTSCGEALVCTRTSGRYTLHVRVAPR